MSSRTYMNIGIVTDTRFPIDPNSGGYTYRIYHLAEEFIRRGHSITLFSPYNSKTSARLISVGPFHGSGDLMYANIEKAIVHSGEFDILNVQLDHCGTLFDAYSQCPVVHTVVYGNHSDVARQILTDHKNASFNALSQSLTRTYPELNWRGVTYNGLSLNDFPFNDSPDEYLFWLGRICPEKGTHLAIDVAKKTNHKLIIGGYINDHDYFDRTIKPHLSERIVHVDWLSLRDKSVYYRNAKAFLFPTMHPEGFGNVMIESLACGTPVIALNNGSVPEIVREGATGFICHDTEEMTHAVEKIHTIDRHTCRKDIEERFTIAAMTDQYEVLYRKIIAEDEHGDTSDDSSALAS